MGKGVKPVYFRFLTLLSFHVFVSENVDTAIYEVGIGGEYDSTNIIQKPTAVGITSIGIDHTRILGNTLASIAWNKGGIMKPGVTAFSSEQPKEAWNTLVARAEEKNVKLVKVPVLNSIARIHLGIEGEFQKINASVSVALAAEHLIKLGIISTEDFTYDSLPTQFVKGLELASWPGRCQTIADGNIKWYLDGAHTNESIAAASHWFKGKVTSSSRKILVFNQQTRDARALVMCLRSLLEDSVNFDEVIFCTNITFSKGTYEPELTSLNVSNSDIQALVVQKELAQKWQELESQSIVEVKPTIEDAIEHVRSSSQDEETQVFVTGSIHLVGGVLYILEN
ncbi:folylpolyglutamate synthase [Dipodascopsis uninucleata]